jgi:hypothetical protein
MRLGWFPTFRFAQDGAPGFYGDAGKTADHSTLPVTLRETASVGMTNYCWIDW